MATTMGYLLLLATIATFVTTGAGATKTPPATFVLGDSLVDVGNNNYLTFTLAVAEWADHKPYGMDRADRKATGRFCNGKIIPDLVSDYLGTPYPLPVLAPEATGANLLHGVNYASAGAGLLEDTGSIITPRSAHSLGRWTSYISISEYNIIISGCLIAVCVSIIVGVVVAATFNILFAIATTRGTS